MSKSEEGRTASTAVSMPPRAPSDRWIVIGWQLAIVVGTLAIWETLVVTGAISEFFFGQPSKVVAYLVENTLNGYLLVQTWVTLYEELMGFVLGTVVGTASDRKSTRLNSSH